MPTNEIYNFQVTPERCAIIIHPSRTQYEEEGSSDEGVAFNAFTHDLEELCEASFLGDGIKGVRPKLDDEKHLP